MKYEVNQHVTNRLHIFRRMLMHLHVHTSRLFVITAMTDTTFSVKAIIAMIFLITII
jgi:hypothetical protein